MVFDAFSRWPADKKLTSLRIYIFLYNMNFLEYSDFVINLVSPLWLELIH